MRQVEDLGLDGYKEEFKGYERRYTRIEGEIQKVLGVIKDTEETLGMANEDPILHRKCIGTFLCFLLV